MGSKKTGKKGEKQSKIVGGQKRRKLVRNKGIIRRQWQISLEAGLQQFSCATSKKKDTAKGKGRGEKRFYLPRGLWSIRLEEASLIRESEARGRPSLCEQK